MSSFLYHPISDHRPETREELFNLRHASRRVKIEITIGRMKARWRILRTGVCGSIKLFNKVAWACACLHNFVEARRTESLVEVWERADREEKCLLEKQDRILSVAEEVEAEGGDRGGETQANQWRDRIADKMWEQYKCVFEERGAAEIMSEMASAAELAVAQPIARRAAGACVSRYFLRGRRPAKAPFDPSQ